MTFRDLQKLMDQQQQALDSPQMQELMKKLRGKPFYIWSTSKHNEVANPNSLTKGYCCFNHIIGLPSKNGKPQPLWDYEEHIYRALMVPGYLNSSPANVNPSGNTIREKRARELARAQLHLHDFKIKHLWIKKATGLGVTEFMLRFMVWLCLRNDDYKNSQMVIITGPNQELAIKCIKRIKALFELHWITFDSKETVINLNGCEIQAYPSNHIDAFRSLTNPKLILLDEADFFRKSEQEEVRHVAERYIAKSDPFIVMLSTPNAPGGLFEQIEKESFESCIYKKLFLDYTYGLDKIYKIYTREEIAKAKQSPSFPREYELKYQGLVGNVLTEKAIQRCISTGEALAKTAPLDDWSIPTKYVMSIDIGWGGSSATAIMVSRFVNGKVQILYSKEFSRALFQDIIDEVWRLKNKCNGNLQNILMDASATELYTTLCNEFNQNPSQQYLKDKQVWCKKVNTYLENHLFIVPIPFNPQGRNMLNHTQRMIEEEEVDGSALVGIHKQFEDLNTSCRSAYAIEDRLDKERTVHADTFDALRMNLQFYRFSN